MLANKFAMRGRRWLQAVAPMNIVHVSDDGGRGGRETYLDALLELGPEWNVQGRLISPDDFLGEGPGLSADVIMVHSRSAWAALGKNQTGIRTIGWAHDYAVFSPGGLNWFPRSETLCPRKVGLACATYAYRQGCTSRQPSRLVKDIALTFESWNNRKRLDRILVASRSVGRRLQEAGAAGDQVDVLPYFVHPDFLKDPPTYVSQRPHVLYLGRLHESKGVHHLVEAWARMPTACTLSIVGAGRESYVARLYRLASTAAPPRLFTIESWAGNRQHVCDLLDKASVLVIPSLWAEPFGIVGLEAMARGRPIIGSRVGGIPEWLDGDSGVIVPPGDVETLTKSLDELVNSLGMQRQLGEAGRARVERLFTWPVHIQRLLGILQR